MCGIAGYIGAKKAQPILLEILRRVEYRGYDSAGIATRRPVDGFNLCRETGKLKKLEEALEARPLSGTTGIGHTRWATHGDQATVQNAHPHITGRVALVHNGTIENYLELKSDLEKLGFTFQSQTDTEVISALVSRYLPDSVNPLEATRRALQRLKGSYALCIMFDVDGYNYLVVARNKSPLIIGFATDGTYVASDVDALAGYVDKVIYLGDEEYGIVGQKGYGFYNLAGMPVQHTTIPVTVQNSEVSKGNYKHWMQKEIFDQPVALGNTLHSLSDPATHRLAFPTLTFQLEKVSRFVIAACGTSHHAGMVAEYWFQTLAKLAVDCKIASEFRYSEPVFVMDQAGIVISQSGETADTFAALEYMTTRHRPTLAIVNKRGSTIARRADSVIYTEAGREIGVASTKAFTCQLLVLAILAIEVGWRRGVIDQERYEMLTQELALLPDRVQQVLDLQDQCAKVAAELVNVRDVFFVGRGTSYPVALEGALKLKEVSYIHAEGYAAGELKHGPLALVENGTPVIAIAPSDHLFEKTASNLEEIRARGGKIILLSDDEGCNKISSRVYMSIRLPRVDHVLTPILYSILLQLIAFDTAVLKGTDIDQPRNLAKSVTVE